MSEGIIIAIIGASATIIAAVIGLIVKTKSKNINVVKQKQKGNGSNIQIGIQNIKKE